jgi:hypothetical protein
MRQPEALWTEYSHAWFWHRASVILGSSTVSRVVTDEPDPEFKRRPVGFTARFDNGTA